MTAATHMLPRDMQLTNEYRYSRKHIDRYIAKEIAENPETEAKVHEGVQRLSDWMSQSYYASKDARLAQLQGLDLEELVRQILVQVAYCQIPELFTSVSAQLASRLKFSEKSDGITTIAEMLAVLCMTDTFDIVKTDRGSSLMVQSQIPLSEQLLTYIGDSRYLPPMVCEPEPLTHNMESAYLTHNDCLILGKGNAHSEDICLDVINRQNRVPLQLATDFLCEMEEEPTFVFKDQQQVDNWTKHKQQSYELYSLLAKQGNRFWLTHKVDKRGRLYAQGYHVTTQGSSFKKAAIELANEERVEGVPGVIY